jgi:hypothetical protein
MTATAWIWHRAAPAGPSGRLIGSYAVSLARHVASDRVMRALTAAPLASVLIGFRHNRGTAAGMALHLNGLEACCGLTIRRPRSEVSDAR